MRLGFVGVGKHAQRMAAAFRHCGAEIVAFDRQTRMGPTAGPMVASSMMVPGVEGFGSFMPWQDMVQSELDAIVCCAPPEVNRLVAESAGCTRLCMSKPFLEPADWGTSGPKYDYVDLWRLYSPAWLALKAELRTRKVTDIAVNFCGNGPVRKTHSGLLDYGPHALAFLLDLGIDAPLEWKCIEEDTFKGARQCWRATGTGDVATIVYTGNSLCGAVPASTAMQVFIETRDGGQYLWHERDSMHTFEAGGAILMQHWRDLALHGFCRAFMTGEPSDTLRISCAAMTMLRVAEPQ